MAAALINADIEFCRRDIPTHRFVEYEPSDLTWLIPLGLAPTINLERRRMMEQIDFEIFMGIVSGNRWP